MAHLKMIDFINQQNVISGDLNLALSWLDLQVNNY